VVGLNRNTSRISTLGFVFRFESDHERRIAAPSNRTDTSFVFFVTSWFRD